MVKGLAALDIRDLQGLRREVNCRMLPEEKRTEKKRKKGDQVSRKPAEPFPLPTEEQALLSLSERVLDLEALKQLVFSHVPFEQEYVQVLSKILHGEIGSISSLAANCFKLQLDGLGADIIEAMDKIREEAVSQAEECEVGRISRRSELVKYGSNPFLATAPHNVFLRRDGCTPHMREDYTTFIAQRLALELEGTALCWTRLEQWRTETRYALGHHRMATQGVTSTNEALDPANRDPNYLCVEELPGNPWHRGLIEWTAQCRRQRHPCQLHVDVHGCQNPPVYPTHMVIGLGAMRRRVEELPQGQKRKDELRRLLAFADLLQETLGPAVAPATGLPSSEIVTITGLGEDGSGGTGQDFLTGVAADPERRTLTQQSLLHVGVSHGLQCEMSHRLRKKLVEEPQAIDAMARTLRSCWRQAVELDGGKTSGNGARR